MKTSFDVKCSPPVKAKKAPWVLAIANASKRSQECDTVTATFSFCFQCIAHWRLPSYPRGNKISLQYQHTAIWKDLFWHSFLVYLLEACKHCVMVRFGLEIFIAATSWTHLGTGRFFAIVHKMRLGKSGLLFLVVFKIISSSVVELICWGANDT